MGGEEAAVCCRVGRRPADSERFGSPRRVGGAGLDQLAEYFDQIRIELKLPDGVKLTPIKGEGPQVKAESDVDPREFLIDVTSWPLDQEIIVQVDYPAFNDDQGWCKAMYCGASPLSDSTMTRCAWLSTGVPLASSR